MKKNLLRIAALTAIFAFGFGLSINTQKEIRTVEAAQFIDDYDPYTYTGSYYNSIDFDATAGMDGALRTSLTSLIQPKGFYTYGGSGSDHLSTQLQYADEDPTNSSNMIYLYTRDSVKKNAASSWNREHVWPQSISGKAPSGEDNWGTTKAGTDLLHIRPTYNKTNEVRGNDKYGDNQKSNPLTYNNMLYGYGGSGAYFEPLDQVKGDVARIIMYVWTTYTGYQGYGPINILNVFQSYDTLLKWHTSDIPDVLEGNRNNYAEKSIQKNRNPFVDHPELAWKIFGDKASSSVKNACMAKYPGDGSTVTPDKTMTGLALSGKPSKTEYYAGQTFDPTGLTVTATYNDGSNKTIPNSSCTWSPNPLTENTTEVTCTYGGFSAKYSGITVTKRDVAGGEYSVEFTKTSDTGTGITNNNIEQYIVSNTLISSVSNTTKVFPGASGLKLGSSSGNGSITFNLNTGAQDNIVGIKIVTQGYNGNGTYTATLGSQVLGTGLKAGTDFEKSLDKVSASSLTIESSGRMYICSISLEIESSQPQPSSSQPIISSSEPISSSQAPISSSEAPISSSELPTSSSEEILSSDPSYSCIDTNSSSKQTTTSSEEIIPTTFSAFSSEEIVNTSENTESSIENSSSIPEQNNDQRKGCGGSIVASISLVSITSLIGLVFVFSKKK